MNVSDDLPLVSIITPSFNTVMFRDLVSIIVEADRRLRVTATPATPIDSSV